MSWICLLVSLFITLWVKPIIERVIIDNIRMALDTIPLLANLKLADAIELLLLAGTFTACLKLLQEFFGSRK
jgi:hypothetical protein